MVAAKFLLVVVHYLPLDVHHVLEFDARVLAMVVAHVLAIMGYLLVVHHFRFVACRILEFPIDIPAMVGYM